MRPGEAIPSRAGCQGMDRGRRHWDRVYAERDVAEVSWYDPVAASSLAVLDAAGVQAPMSVVDVGAGASGLAGALLDRGITDVTAVDLADGALAVARRRLGAAGDRVCWVSADVLEWTPGRRFDVWHDRAVFHFLTTPDERRRYLSVLGAALNPGGRVVVGTFAADGPQRCSGLPTARYDPAGLVAALAASPPGLRFEVLTERREEHRTPAGAVQPFTWVGLRHAPQA